MSPIPTPRQGDIYLSDPSPLTGERELYVIVTNDSYNDSSAPTVMVAEIETGTRYRATSYATETDYGVVLADRIVYYPTTMLGQPYGGRLTDEQLRKVIQQITTVITP